jgi:hypothetical protein
MEVEAYNSIFLCNVHWLILATPVQRSLQNTYIYATLLYFVILEQIRNKGIYKFLYQGSIYIKGWIFMPEWITG